MDSNDTPTHDQLNHQPDEIIEPPLQQHPRQARRSGVPTYGRLNSIPPFADGAAEGEGRTAGIIGTSFNLLNTIIGAGIVGIPYAMRECGFVAGTVMFVLVSYLTDKSLRTLVESAWVVEMKDATTTSKTGESESTESSQEIEGQCANTVRNPVTSYEELMSRLFGKPGKRLMQVMIFIGSYGSMIAYLIIIKDTVPNVLSSMGLTQDLLGWLGSRGAILVMTSLLILVPLSMQRNLASLSIVSCISVSADIILVAFVAARAPIRDSISNFPGGLSSILWHNTGNAFDIFVAIGIFTFALGCQGATFIIYQSLSDRTPRRWSKVTMIGVGFSSMLSFMMGVTGYLGYLDNTKGDILLNLDADSVVANVARALLAITIILTYPMAAFVCRHVVLEMLEIDGKGNDYEVEEDDGRPFRDGEVDEGNDQDQFEEEIDGGSSSGLKGIKCLDLRQRLTLLLYTMALVPALVFDDLGFILSISGALGGSIRNYIAPGIIYLGAHGEDFISYASGLLARQHHSLHCEDHEDGRGKSKQVEMSQLGHRQSQANDTEYSNAVKSERSGADTDCSMGEKLSPLPKSSETPKNKAPRNKPESNLELPLEGVQRDMTIQTNQRSFLTVNKKPLWWYLFGFPIWCAVAEQGITSVAKNDAVAPAIANEYSSNSVDTEEPDDECDSSANGGDFLSRRRDEFNQKVQPSAVDYAIAIFFIMFGILAGTIGLGVNIYKEVAKMHKMND